MVPAALEFGRKSVTSPQMRDHSPSPDQPLTNQQPCSVDVALVGAGIVGLATAHRILAARPGLRLVVLDKEPRVASHQSGRNSGVLHSGIYYAPGSLKAQTVRAGRIAMLEFCAAHGVATRICGKVITMKAWNRVAPRLRATRSWFMS